MQARKIPSLVKKKNIKIQMLAEVLNYKTTANICEAHVRVPRRLCRSEKYEGKYKKWNRDRTDEETEDISV